MFASIRRYRLQQGSMDTLTQRVDKSFADELSARDGFVSYEFIDCGDGEIMTVSIFRDEAGAEDADDRALEFVRGELAASDLERTEVIGGTVSVSRAMAQLLEPAHA